MKINKLWLLIALVAVGLIGFMPLAYAAHPTVDGLGNPISVVLKDAAGNAIVAASQTPYSPKQTCGGCHNYESDVTTVSKTQMGAAYNVVVPQHGVTVGYHFQQGRNVGWGSAQKSFYGVPGFTSSPGMYGKY